MARSRKKTPCCHCAGHDGSWKRIYNRKLRRNPIDYDEGVSSVQDGNAYKRVNESWEISDLKETHLAFEEYLPGCFDSEEERRDNYEKFFIRK